MANVGNAKKDIRAAETLIAMGSLRRAALYLGESSSLVANRVYRAMRRNLVTAEERMAILRLLTANRARVKALHASQRRMTV